MRFTTAIAFAGALTIAHVSAQQPPAQPRRSCPPAAVDSAWAVCR